MPYQPIEDYGVIGDLATLALVATDGSIDYMCFPHFDSPTVFAALLDDKRGGRFAISPAGEKPRRKQMYLPDTNVLLTRFLSPSGVGEIVDFMPISRVRHTHVIVRMVRGIRGPITFQLSCGPRFDYARAAHSVQMGDGEVLFIADDPDRTTLRLRTPVTLEERDGDVVGEFTLRAGEGAIFVLEAVRADIPSSSADPGWAHRAFEETVDYWRRWLARVDYRGRWFDMVARSALAMKLLTNRAFGSIAAAGTFGLPEEIGGERNWDYRFTWIRDASLTASVLIRLGLTEEARAFMTWIGDRLRECDVPGKLQIMYGIDGRHEIEEETLDHLEGYRQSAPVRIGNAAFGQLQLDIYGELLYFLDLFDERVEPLPYDLWRDVTQAVDWVSDNWQRTDEGIWEVRGGQQKFLYSRLMDWVALERAVRIARRRALPAALARWESARDEIHQHIYRDFWNDERRAFVQHDGSTTLDASCLLMPIVGFISSRDPRWLSTLEAVERELVDDTLVYRYLSQEAAADGLTGSEGTFAMCSYWYVECVARAGDLEKARLLFEKMHTYANHLGLYAEEMDSTGRYLGNFPQAFTHLGLIGAALYLDEALSRRTPL